MKKIRSILETLSTTASIKEKQSFLTLHKDNDKLFLLLQMHQNPYRQFYVAKFPTVRPDAESVSLGGGSNFDKFLHLCGLLTSRDLSGHQALATIYDFFKDCDEDERYVFETILLKKPLNFGASLINKVYPKWVPEFDLMLADADQPKLSDITYPIIAQHKLDGFRAVYFPKERMFLGRNGKAIRNENLAKYFEGLSVNKDYVLDGELYSDTLNFNQIASALNSETKSLDGIYYCVYDLIREEDWKNQVSTLTYENRWKNLNTLIKEKWNVPHVKVINGIVANNEAEITHFYTEVLSQGYEGLMLKSLSGTYHWKRVSVKSQVMMKLKPHDEYDGKIVGFEEGEGKHTGKLGVFIVEIDKITNPVKVGSGFTDEERETYWKSREKCIGEWIKLKGFEVTENNESLRFPIFLAFRDAKD